jgi:hypothetical protein
MNVANPGGSGADPEGLEQILRYKQLGSWFGSFKDELIAKRSATLGSELPPSGLHQSILRQTKIACQAGESASRIS